MTTSSILLAMIFFLAQVPAQERLRQDVESYWEAMEKGDKYSALEYVLPDARNAFIQRQEFMFRNWSVEEIRSLNQAKAQVVVSAERLLEQSGRFYPTPIRQIWVYQDDRWYLSVPKMDSKQVHELLYGLRRPQGRVPAGQVQVAPETLKMSFLNPVQRAAIVVRNGLEESLQVVDLSFDESKFEIEELPDTVSPDSEVRIYLRYVGDEEEKDLRSRAELVLLGEKDGKRRSFPLEILYNHVSETTKAFFGLTDEEARRLKKGEKLTPKLPTPANAGQAPPGLPEELLQPEDPSSEEP